MLDGVDGGGEFNMQCNMAAKKKKLGGGSTQDGIDDQDSDSEDLFSAVSRPFYCSFIPFFSM